MKKQLPDLLNSDEGSATFRTQLFSNACSGPTVFSFNKSDELICSNPLLSPTFEGVPEIFHSRAQLNA